MPPVRTADHFLARYPDTDNLDRARAFSASRPRHLEPGTEAGVSIVILNRDRPEFIGPLLGQLRTEVRLLRDAGLDAEVLIGDTGSTHPQVLALYEGVGADVRVLRGLDYHFSANNNDVFAAGQRFDHVLFLNNDVSFEHATGAIGAMRAEFARHPGTGTVGLFMDLPDGTVQHLGIDVLRSEPLRHFIGHPGVGSVIPHRPGSSWPAVAVTGACLMVPSALFAEVGGFDETYEMECQDVDLCLRLHRLGAPSRVVDAGPAVHVENGTREPGEESWPDRRRFMRRWESYLEAAFL